MSEEQFKAYEPNLLYYDKAVLEELSNIDYTAEVIPEITLPDPSKPELVEEPVPVLPDVSSSEKISARYLVSREAYAFAFVANGVHEEKTIEFLEYLMKLKNDNKVPFWRLNPKWHFWMREFFVDKSFTKRNIRCKYNVYCKIC